MNSKKLFEEISQQKSLVTSLCEKRNFEYSEYLQSSTAYDNLKKGFYIALKLAKIDKIIPEERK